MNFLLYLSKRKQDGGDDWDDTNYPTAKPIFDEIKGN